jgi:hypothetical protein
VRQLQQRRSLALVVACTQGKTVPAAKELLVRNLAEGSDRCRLWVERVKGATTTVPLRQLYKGQQWSASVALEQVAIEAYASVQLWVFSAGLGLQRAEEPAPGYGASFTTGPDAVARDRASRRSWWGELHTLTGADIAAVRNTADEMLVVLAPSYLQVLEPDLASVDDDGVAVMTSTRGTYARTVTGTGLQSALGGSDQTLNQRAAAQLINFATDSPLGSGSVLAEYAAWADPLRATRSYDRVPLDDDVLRKMITACAAAGPQSATGTLQQLRRDGYACEQKRFHRLYAETVGGAS